MASGALGEGWKASARGALDTTTMDADDGNGFADSVHVRRSDNRGALDITLDLLRNASNNFKAPENSTAKAIGVCATVLKVACRELGLNKWPHRVWKRCEYVHSAYTKEAQQAEEEADSLEQQLLATVGDGSGGGAAVGAATAAGGPRGAVPLPLGSPLAVRIQELRSYAEDRRSRVRQMDAWWDSVAADPAGRDLSQDPFFQDCIVRWARPLYKEKHRLKMAAAADGSDAESGDDAGGGSDGGGGGGGRGGGRGSGLGGRRGGGRGRGRGRSSSRGGGRGGRGGAQQRSISRGAAAAAPAGPAGWRAGEVRGWTGAGCEERGAMGEEVLGSAESLAIGAGCGGNFSAGVGAGAGAGASAGAGACLLDLGGSGSDATQSTISTVPDGGWGLDAGTGAATVAGTAAGAAVHVPSRRDPRVAMGLHKASAAATAAAAAAATQLPSRLVPPPQPLVQLLPRWDGQGGDAETEARGDDELPSPASAEHGRQRQPNTLQEMQRHRPHREHEQPDPKRPRLQPLSNPEAPNRSCPPPKYGCSQSPFSLADVDAGNQAVRTCAAPGLKLQGENGSGSAGANTGSGGAAGSTEQHRSESSLGYQSLRALAAAAEAAEVARAEEDLQNGALPSGRLQEALLRAGSRGVGGAAAPAPAPAPMHALATRSWPQHAPEPMQPEAEPTAAGTTQPLRDSASAPPAAGPRYAAQPPAPLLLPPQQFVQDPQGRTVLPAAASGGERSKVGSAQAAVARDPRRSSDGTWHGAAAASAAPAGGCLPGNATPTAPASPTEAYRGSGMGPGGSSGHPAQPWLQAPPTIPAPEQQQQLPSSYLQLQCLPGQHLRRSSQLPQQLATSPSPPQRAVPPHLQQLPRQQQPPQLDDAVAQRQQRERHSPRLQQQHQPQVQHPQQPQEQAQLHERPPRIQDQAQQLQQQGQRAQEREQHSQQLQQQRRRVADLETELRESARKAAAAERAQQNAELKSQIMERQLMKVMQENAELRVQSMSMERQVAELQQRADAAEEQRMATAAALAEALAEAAELRKRLAAAEARALAAAAPPPGVAGQWGSV